MEEEKNNKKYKVFFESILRLEPSLNSKLITVLLANTQWELLEDKNKEKIGEIYSKIKIII